MLIIGSIIYEKETYVEWVLNLLIFNKLDIEESVWLFFIY